MLGALGFAIGLGTLASGGVPLAPSARGAAWVATAGAVLLAVEYLIHLRVYVAADVALARAAVPFLSTHTVTSQLVYPIFFLAMAALAVLSGRTLTNRAVGLVGAAGALIWGVAPALVELAGIDLPTLLFAIGGLLSTAWFTVVGVTGLVRHRSARARA